MGILIKSPEFNLNKVEMSSGDIDKLINQYTRLQVGGSVEGISSVTTNIVYGLGDYLVKLANNLKTVVTGALKDVKRSELQLTIDKHRLSYTRLNRADYSEVFKGSTGFYPFKKDPASVAAFCHDEFKRLKMGSRLPEIADCYHILSSSIGSGDSSKTIAMIEKINGLNVPANSSSIKSQLEEMIVVHIPTKLSTIGATFDSVSDITSAVTSTLSSEDELNQAVSVGKRLNHLYEGFEGIQKALHVNLDKGHDISSLKGLPQMVKDTGELIESYAMLVREYHHLDHYLSVVLGSAISRL